MSTQTVRLDLNMGIRCRFVTLFTLGVTVYLATKYYNGCHNNEFDAEFIRKDSYFGHKLLKAGDPFPADSTEIKPYKIAYPEVDLQDLKQRLERTKFVENNLEDVQFNYGFPSKYLKEVVKYWQTKYDWRREEAKLNSYPHFITQIEGLDIHFVHVKADKSAKMVVPLLAVHGWPGSFLEYMKSIPLLTKPDSDGLAYELVIPSIPGYGYSQAPHKKGFDVRAAGRIFVKLMKRLGHEKFLAHGGDWGTFISKMISIGFPQNVIGTHVLMNMIPLPNSPARIARSVLAANVPSLYFGENSQQNYEKGFPLSEKFIELLLETGYMHLQSTKPDTIGSALRDSPVGLAAYILEKFSTWTSRENRNLADGGLTKKFTMDELLTNIMIYWTSGNIASSQRFYKENIVLIFEFDKLVVPGYSGTIDCPNELVRAPRKLIESTYENLIHYTEMPRGGHFFAFEEPQLASDDIRLFTKRVFKHMQDAQSISSKDKQKKDEM